MDWLLVCIKGHDCTKTVHVVYQHAYVHLHIISGKSTTLGLW